MGFGAAFSNARTVPPSQCAALERKLNLRIKINYMKEKPGKNRAGGYISTYPDIDLDELHLSPEIHQILRYFKSAFGTPFGTGLAAYATIILALKSRRLTVRWPSDYAGSLDVDAEMIGDVFVPSLGFTLLHFKSFPASPLLQVLWAHLKKCVPRPHPDNWSIEEFERRKRRRLEICEEMKRQHRDTKVCPFWPEELIDDLDELRSERVIFCRDSLRNFCGIGFSTLLLEPWTRGSYEPGILQIRPPERPVPWQMKIPFMPRFSATPSSLVCVDPRFLKSFLTDPKLGRWDIMPAILPDGMKGASSLTNCIPDGQYTRLIIKRLCDANAVWSPTHRPFHVPREIDQMWSDVHGTAIWNRLQHLNRGSCVDFRKIFAAFAVWHHLEHEGGSAICAKSWEAARSFTRWAVDAHITSVCTVLGN